MPDMLERGAEWLERMRVAHMTGTVEIRRGAAGTAVPATVGKTVFDVTRDYGVVEKFESRDFLIARADYASRRWRYCCLNL
jgi:hypothetical protein